jgi:hypothetical protein
LYGDLLALCPLAPGDVRAICLLCCLILGVRNHPRRFFCSGGAKALNLPRNVFSLLVRARCESVSECCGQTVAGNCRTKKTRATCNSGLPLMCSSGLPLTCNSGFPLMRNSGLSLRGNNAPLFNPNGGLPPMCALLYACATNNEHK